MKPKSVLIKSLPDFDSTERADTLKFPRKLWDKTDDNFFVCKTFFKKMWSKSMEIYIITELIQTHKRFIYIVLKKVERSQIWQVKRMVQGTTYPEAF